MMYQHQSNQRYKHFYVWRTHSSYEQKNSKLNKGICPSYALLSSNQ